MIETMENETTSASTDLPSGVMFNAYPDSIGRNLADTVDMLGRPEFKDVFSLFYILPTVFHSDLDRGFSVIDYDLNEELVSRDDLDALDALGIGFKFDLVLNHLSVNSPQFQDLLERGDQSEYRDFFIDWNEFWDSHGEPGPDGYVIPKPEHLDKLFMRKPGLPILKVRFPDGSERPYWNTFYKEISYPEITAEYLLEAVDGERLTPADAEWIAAVVNTAIGEGGELGGVDLGDYADLKDEIVDAIEKTAPVSRANGSQRPVPEGLGFLRRNPGQAARSRRQAHPARCVRLPAQAAGRKQLLQQAGHLGIPGEGEGAGGQA